MDDIIVAVIWIAFMIIAAISAIAKKAKQQQEQARRSAGEKTKSEPVYKAPEEDIRDFLEQIGAKPKPPPAQLQLVQQPQPVRSKRPRRKKPAAGKKASRRSTEEAPEVREIPTVGATVTALTGRLSPIQRAVVWREILDSPPGLRTGAFVREV